MVEIRSMTVLPAIRDEIELVTADGLKLVGELSLPVSGKVAATLVTMHPLPTHGGFMDSHVYRKAAWRLPHLADIAVLRFNTRGTSSPRGTSEGSFDEGVGERFDLEAAVKFVNDRGLPNPWLVGWSFGTELILKYGAKENVLGAILLSPPLHRATESDIELWTRSQKPVKILVPEHDDFLKPAAAAVRFSSLTQAELVAVPEAKHLWVGEKFVRIVLDEIVKTVSPQDYPLRTEVVEEEIVS